MGRNILATFLAVLGCLMVPISLVPAWVGTYLINTDNFVHQFAPLATSPAFQRLVAQEAGEVTTETISDFVSNDFLDQFILGDLVDTAAGGVGNFVETQILSILQSEQFPPLWDSALGRLHDQFVDAVRGGETEFTLELEVAPIVSQLRTNLVADGAAWAQLIPEIGADVTIPLVLVEISPAVAWAFHLSDAFQWLLPAIAAALIILAVLLALPRSIAFALCGLGSAVTSLAALLTLTRWGPLVLTDLVAGMEITSILWSLAIQPLETWLALAGVVGLGAALAGLVVALLRPAPKPKKTKKRPKQRTR